MKTKIFKKLIAALCAATMSTSIVIPTGAITTTAKLSPQDNPRFLALNTMISSHLDMLNQMKNTISSWKQDTEIQKTNKEIALNQVNSILTNLTNINKLVSPDIALLNQIDEKLHKLDAQISKLSELAVSVKETNEYNDINFDLINLNTDMENIYKYAVNYIKNPNNNNNMNNNNFNNNTSIINNNMNRINNNMSMMNSMNNMNRINNNISMMNSMNNMNMINNISIMNSIMFMNMMNMNTKISTLVSELKKRNFPMNYNDISLSPPIQRLISYASINDMIKLAQLISSEWFPPEARMHGLNYFVNQNLHSFDGFSDAFLNEARTEIDAMLMQAINNMKPVNIDNLEQKFKDIHAGMQSLNNCWLFSAQNVINYYKYFKKGEQPLKKAPVNPADNPVDAPRDIVEQEFINHGGDPNMLHSGQHYIHIQDYLKKYDISTKSFHMINHDKSPQRYLLMAKIAKMLLLKHFNSYESPVIILNQGHYLTICGVDAKNDQALVIDSCHKDLRKISLSNLCMDAARSLEMGKPTLPSDKKDPTENIVLIFTNMSSLYPENLIYQMNEVWPDFKALCLDNVFRE